MFKGLIKKKIIAAIKELYAEYVADGELKIVPDVRNKGVMITWSSKK